MHYPILTSNRLKGQDKPFSSGQLWQKVHSGLQYVSPKTNKENRDGDNSDNHINTNNDLLNSSINNMALLC